MEFQSLWEKIKEHDAGKILGTVLGVLLGIFILCIGFFKTLFIFLCAGVGFVVGKRMDEKADFSELLSKIIPSDFRK